MYSVKLIIKRTALQGVLGEPVATIHFVPREETVKADLNSGKKVPDYLQDISAKNKQDVLMIPNLSVDLPNTSPLIINASYYLGNAGLNVLVQHNNKHILSIGCLCNVTGTASLNNPYFAVLLENGDFIEFLVTREA